MHEQSSQKGITIQAKLADCDNLRETVREIIRRERPPGIFKVHMETRPELQSEQEVDADL